MCLCPAYLDCFHYIASEHNNRYCRRTKQKTGGLLINHRTLLTRTLDLKYICTSSLGLLMRKNCGDCNGGERAPSPPLLQAHRLADKLVPSPVLWFLVAVISTLLFFIHKADSCTGMDSYTPHLAPSSNQRSLLKYPKFSPYLLKWK